MTLATKRALRILSREASAAKGQMPEPFTERVWAHFDRDTRRAILRLYRSAPEQVLEGYGDRAARRRRLALVLGRPA